MAMVLGTALASTVAASAHAEDPKCTDGYEQGQVLRKEGRLLRAREELRACVNTCTRDAFKKSCSEWLSQTEAEIPTIVLYAKNPAGSALVDVAVTIDGAPLVTTLDGRPRDVDPGPHTFVFALADGTKKEVRVTILTGTKDQSVSATLGEAPAPKPTASTAGVGTAPSSGWQRPTGLVIGGAGVLALGVGAVFGFLALSAKSDMDNHCGSAINAPPGKCDPQGLSSHDDASSRATLSTILVAGGAALAAGGALLFFTAPNAGSSAPQVGIGPQSIWIRGSF
jgi:hypothetical protein